MKTKLYLIICLLSLTAGTCKKEGKDCHYQIKIKNNSGNEIIAAIPLVNANNKCRLDGEKINKGGFFDYRPFNFCIENSMSSSTTQDIYIIDPALYNSIDTYYNCDSIEIKNKVLKHYVLTLEDLKQTNFTVTYQ